MAYKKFPSKVLLFGEHLLLRGGTALAVPVHRYGGHWAWSPKGKKVDLQISLRSFANSPALQSIPGMDTDAFNTEIDRGIWFNSDIPPGYGLGSSGVLCAAVYDRYCREKTGDLNELKMILAQMESTFHGRSSGIDPLTSYLNTAIMVHHENEVKKVICKDWTKDLGIYLLDTRLQRQSGPIIRHFIEKCEHPAYANLIDQYIQSVHEPLMADFLAGNYKDCWDNIARVSAFQWENQRFMIPEDMHYRFYKGIERGDYFLKICGAGGGGFMLLFAKDKAVVQFISKLHRLTELTVPGIE